MTPSGRLALFPRETHLLPVERSQDVARVLTELLAPPELAPAARGTREG